MLGFTDRPLREAQAGTVERIGEAWPDMFGDSNPNGVVVAHNQSGATNSAVLEFMEPKLNGSNLTYTFEQVSVFIDDVPVTRWVCESPPGGVVDPPGVLNSPIAPDVWRSECQIKGGFPIPQKG